jgi:MFS family permease
LSRRARLVLVGTCLNAVGNGFVLPFLVIYLHEVRHLSLAVTGAVIATEAAVGLVAVPVYGVLIDRFGSRRVQLATLVMSTCGSLGLAVATHAVAAAAATAVLGLGGAGMWPSSQALVAELVPSQTRGRYFSLSFLLLNLGIGGGGIAGAAVVRTGHPGTYQALFVADAATYVVFLGILATLREVGRRFPRPAESDETAAPTSYRALLGRPAFRRVVAVQLVLVLAGYAQLDAAFPAFARQQGASPRVVGIAFAVNTAVIVAGQMWVQRRSAAWRRTRALVAVSGCWAVSWVLLGAAALAPAGAPVVAVVIAFAAAFAVGEMLLSPVLPAVVNDLADDHLRGRYNAGVSWSWSVGNVIGPVVGGAVLGAGAPGLWIGLAVGGCAVAAVFAVRLERVLPRLANGGVEAVEALEPAQLCGLITP